MLSNAKVSELEVSLDEIEREKFSVFDKLKSKELKLRELVKTIQALPMHE